MRICHRLRTLRITCDIDAGIGAPTGAGSARSADPCPRCGAWPGSNTHMYGSRSYDLRDTTAGVEVRIHDAIDFQGVGMKPGDMPPTRHTCTAWEQLPSSITMPQATSCDAAKPTCDAIRAFYTSTTRADADESSLISSPSDYYGRGTGACG